MPFVAGLRTPPSQPIGIVLPKLPTPLTDGFMGHRDAALEQQFFHIAVAQGEAIIEPDSMADDLTGEAMVLITFRVSGWSHVSCLSCGWLGPCWGIAVVIMSRTGKDGQQLERIRISFFKIPSSARLY
jgi:hypothetical protein